MDQTDSIRIFLLRSVTTHPKNLVRYAAEHFALSRQAIYRHIEKLLDEGLLVAKGRTRAREYSLATLSADQFVLALDGLDEDTAWREKVRPLILGLSENARRISQYGFTEILNNAIVHSRGDRAVVDVTVTPISAQYSIYDNGVGIFRKLKDELRLDDERHSILELAKGKLTTNPAKHTGEGIFFTTRSFDDVAIRAGELAFLHTISGDWLIDERPPIEGTFVQLEIDSLTKRSLAAVFDAYTFGDDDFGFSRTQIPIFLAKYGDENLVSRSQAKRVVARLDRFKAATLDFTGVATIGQAFADEIFRVFAGEHPDVQLSWSNASKEVAAMIKRATTRAVNQANSA